MEAVYMVGGIALMLTFYYGSKLFAVPRWRREYAEFRAWREAMIAGTVPTFHGAPAAPTAAQSTTPAPLPAAPVVALPGAGYALASPPASLQATLRNLADRPAARPYVFPLGWARGVGGVAGLTTAAFVGDVNHVLITGQSDVGKDNLSLNILLTLAMRHAPSELQICVIDGKGLDFVGWAGKAHSWRLALTPEEIAPAMAALTAERQRRRAVLAECGASKWEPRGRHGLPLLVVYISELSLLEDAAGGPALTQFLNTELSAGRAFGVRYIIATQTASNFATRWRSQIGLYLAGFQPSASQDTPNTGLTSAELSSAESVAPSALPSPPAGAGVFTCVQGRDCQTVRSTYLSDDQRRAWLQRLPDAPAPADVWSDVLDSQAATPPATRPATPPATVAQPAAVPSVAGARAVAVQSPERPAAATVATVATPGNTTADLSVEPAPAPSEAATPATPPAAAVDVAPADRARILALAAEGLSRRKICEQVYGSIGSRGYDRIKSVLDTLPPAPVLDSAPLASTSPSVGAGASPAAPSTGMVASDQGASPAAAHQLVNAPAPAAPPQRPASTAPAAAQPATAPRSMPAPQQPRSDTEQPSAAALAA